MSGSHRFTLPLTIGAALLLAPSSALAGAPDNIPDGMAWVNGKGLVSTVLEIDAASISKATGMSKERALARLKAGARLDADLASLETNHEGFAGYRWDGDDMVLMFKGDIPTGQVAEIREKSNVTVRTEAVDYSLSDQDQRAREAIEELLGAGVPAKDIFVSIDMRTGEILATVRETDTERQASLRSRVKQRLGNESAKVEFTSGPVLRSQVAWGGGELRIGGTQDCTVGFTVQKNDNTGVASAGHCANDYTYFNFVTSDSHDTTFKLRHEGGWGDFGWYTTNGNEIDDFIYNDAGDRRDVTGTKQSLLGLGDTVHGYGNRGDDYVGTVVKRGMTAGGVESLICLDDSYTLGGDSGGPVYNGGSAIGFHFGIVVWDGAWRSCHSQARFLDDAIGATILND